MKADKLMDAITELDDDILNEAAGEPSAAARSKAKPGKKPLIFRFAAAAAALAVTVGGIFMITRKPVQNISGSESSQNTYGTDSSQNMPVTEPSKNTSVTDPSQDLPGTDPSDTSGIITGGPTNAAPGDSFSGSANGNANGGVSYGSLSEQALASPVYPAEWSWHMEQENVTARWDQVPYAARVAAGREAAETYRSFFADTMLLLLSDQKEESTVMSPVNIFMATAMLAEITDGQTRQEILDALGVKDIEELRDQTAKIWGLCYRDDGREKTVLGNSLWLSSELNYRPDTIKRLADSYYASSFSGEMGSEEYNDLLRTWLSDMTGGLLKDQINGLDLTPDTALALCSTILHETKWVREFSESSTKQGVFHSPSGDIRTDFMYSQHDLTGYFDAENYRFIQRSTKQGRVWLFLPDEGVSVSEMMQEESFLQFISSPYDYRDYYDIDISGGSLTPKTNYGITPVTALVNLTVPKLDISFRQDLTEALQTLGIKTAFDPSAADYTTITDQPGVYLQQASQGTRLIMDEEGISAASYVMYAEGALFHEDEIDLIFDRPFFMMVTGANDVPLFAGVVNEP